MKKWMVLIVVGLMLNLLPACVDSHFYAEDETGKEVLIHNLNVGPLFYYPGMVLWNVGIAAPITIAEFYACFGLFVPVAALTNNGEFIGCPDFLQKTMGIIVFENHIPFLPVSAIDYEREHPQKHKIQGL